MAKTEVPRWAKVTLYAAGVYNLLWGTWIVLMPLAYFQLLGLDEPRYPEIWQCVGMVVGVYGIGYWIAARDPARHWPIVLVGLLGKLLGPVGFLLAAIGGDLPWSFGLVNLANDLVWWIPFVALLIYAVRVNSDRSAGSEPLSWTEAIGSIESHRGHSMGELSNDGPVLILFLRHAGCTFCREALSDLAQQRRAIEALGVKLAIVHLDDRQHGADLTRRYELDDVDRYSDPACQLYRAFDLRRGRIWDLFGPTVMARALPVLWRGHGMGRVRGDGFRMPGVFVLHAGKIVAAYRHRTAGDRPDYAALAKQGVGEQSVLVAAVAARV